MFLPMGRSLQTPTTHVSNNFADVKHRDEPKTPRCTEPIGHFRGRNRCSRTKEAPPTFASLFLSVFAGGCHTDSSERKPTLARQSCLVFSPAVRHSLSPTNIQSIPAYIAGLSSHPNPYLAGLKELQPFLRNPFFPTKNESAKIRNRSGQQEVNQEGSSPLHFFSES